MHFIALSLLGNHVFNLSDGVSHSFVALRFVNALDNILQNALFIVVDYAIAQGMQKVEAGAQGEHKLARGYLPVATHSLHWFGDAGFKDAVERYLVAEREAVDHEIEVLTTYGPFRKANVEEQE